MTEGRINGYRYRPSLGFLLVCLVYAAGLVFLLWGARQPDLDRVWFLQHELWTGERSHLEADDLALLLDALDRYPDLCQALVEEEGEDLVLLSAHRENYMETDAAYILRRAGGTTRQLVLSCQGPAAAWPVQITARTVTGVGERILANLTVTGSGVVPVELGEASRPEIVEIKCSCPPDADHQGIHPLEHVSVQIIAGGRTR